MNSLLNQLLTRDLAADPLAPADAEALLGARGPELTLLLAIAHRVRLEHCGDTVRLCGIVNARSGGCTEDCAFCAQARGASTDAPVHAMLEVEPIVEAARRAAAAGAREFSIVTSGRELHREREIARVCEAVARIREETGLETCASLGCVSAEDLRRLAAAGLDRFHHNLETAPSHFEKICSTHPYSERVATARRVREAGLKLCCGGIFGLGESAAQRVELALTLGELSPDSVPINFLNPVPGTPLGGQALLPPEEALALVAVMRLLLPDRDLILCGGREVTLRSLQPLALLAGANGLLVGDYLTTEGQAPERDLEMIADLGLQPLDLRR